MTHSFPTLRSSDLATALADTGVSLGVRRLDRGRCESIMMDGRTGVGGTRRLKRQGWRQSCCETAYLLITLTTTDARVLSSWLRSEEHTSELQSLMRISYAVFRLKKKKHTTH